MCAEVRYANVLAAIPRLADGEIDWANYPPILGYAPFGFPVFTHEHACYSTAPEYFDGWEMPDLQEVARLLRESALKSMESDRKAKGRKWEGYVNAEYPEKAAISLVTELIGLEARRLESAG